MRELDIVGMSLAETGSAIHKRELSPLEVIDSFLSRIEKFNEILNIFVTVRKNEAYEKAREIERAIEGNGDLGPLLGLPLGLKDKISVAGTRLTAGSSMLEDNIAEDDACVASKLRNADGIILGMLHMHEWGFGGDNPNQFLGHARNPWDISRSLGGSSTGSGGALAANMCLGTIGTDGGGSILIPSSFSGVTGLRPTAGRVSKRGVLPASWSMGTVGPMARRAKDVALLLQVIAGYDPLDPTSIDIPVTDYSSELDEGVRNWRIGFLRGYFGESLDSDISSALEEMAHRFAELGAHIEEVTLSGAEDANVWARTIILAEGAAVHERNLKIRANEFGSEVLDRLIAGLEISGVKYARARQEQREWRRILEQKFLEFDLLLAPTCGTLPPKLSGNEAVGTIQLITKFTYPLCFARIPILSIPSGFSKTELPIGAMLIGPPWSEGRLLRAAAAYQEITNWHLRAPDLEEVIIRSENEGSEL